MPTNGVHFSGNPGKQIVVLVVLGVIVVPRTVVATPIVGGNFVERTGGEPKYPFMVSLQDRVEIDNVTTKWQHFCGGSLISSSWILTAAHCVHRKKPHQIVAVIGEENISKFKHLDYHEIDAIETFSFHTITYNNDIALLSLRQPYKAPYATTMDKWIYAKLPQNGMKANRKVPCKIIGYGATQHAGSTQSNLREGEVNVITNKKCEKILGHVWAPQTGEKKVCALGVEQDTCQGDSGGPLICAYRSQDYIYGIVSHGLTCGMTGVPSIFTVTIPYLDWIHSLIKKIE